MFVELHLIVWDWEVHWGIALNFLFFSFTLRVCNLLHDHPNKIEAFYEYNQSETDSCDGHQCVEADLDQRTVEDDQKQDSFKEVKKRADFVMPV